MSKKKTTKKVVTEKKTVTKPAGKERYEETEKNLEGITEEDLGREDEGLVKANVEIDTEGDETGKMGLNHEQEEDKVEEDELPEEKPAEEPVKAEEKKSKAKKVEEEQSFQRRRGVVVGETNY